MSPQCCGWRPSIPCARQAVLTADDPTCSPWPCPFLYVLLGAFTVWGHCTGHHSNVIVSPCSNPKPCKLHSLAVRFQPLEGDPRSWTPSTSTAKGSLALWLLFPSTMGSLLESQNTLGCRSRLLHRKQPGLGSGPGQGKGLG